MPHIDYKSIREATQLYINWQEAAYHTSNSWNRAELFIKDWYDHTDITDPYMLAALALHFGGYKSVNYKIAEIIKNDYFGGIEI